jgi:hypothetical protein
MVSDSDPSNASRTSRNWVTQTLLSDLNRSVFDDKTDEDLKFNENSQLLSLVLRYSSLAQPRKQVDPTEHSRPQALRVDLFFLFDLFINLRANGTCHCDSSWT